MRNVYKENKTKKKNNVQSREEIDFIEFVEINKIH